LIFTKANTTKSSKSLLPSSSRFLFSLCCLKIQLELTSNVTLVSVVLLDLRELVYKVLVHALETVDRNFVMHISVHDVLKLGLLNVRFEQRGVEV
jgi:hypothetical protein